MPINAYCGLPRSGKSYEVVSEIIIPAIRSGRRVVTNVDGISNDLIRHFIIETHKGKEPIDPDALGSVFHVTNTQVVSPEFLPYETDGTLASTDTIVQPGDMVVIDEAWRPWGTDCKIHKNHKSFFSEHGHFTNEKTGVSCDLVVMTQDFSALHRTLKNLVAFSFRTHKKVSLGMSNTYSLSMWEGPKQVRGALIGNWVRRYNKKIFPLYSSFKGGADGVMVNIDSRQNIFTNKRLWFVIALVIIGGFFSARTVWKYFHPVDPNAEKAVVSAPAPGAPVSGPMLKPAAPLPSYSPEMRYVGELRFGTVAYAIVSANGGSLVRLESPSSFTGRGLQAVGNIDAQRVTTFSGVAQNEGFLGSRPNSPPPPSPAPAPPAPGKPHV